MDSSFFNAKRPWSRYKDFLLQSYLEPYIPKVAKLRKPILIVDCFAGRGSFDDGEPGSPLIIAKAIQTWRATALRSLVNSLKLTHRTSMR
jgi:three-Cys-motif partner protein